MQPIHLAASGDKTRIVDILVDEYHVDPQAKVLYTYRQIVASFTSYIAMSFFIQDQDGMAPIHHAAIWGLTDMISNLITKHKVDPKSRGKVSTL